MKKSETKRGAERIRFEMPERLEKGSGVTCDVSQSGVFFFTDQTFSPALPQRARVFK